MLKPTLHLTPLQLCRRADLSSAGFDTTDDLPDLTEVVGQERGIEAIRFGTGMQNGGFNIFALGPQGLELRELVQGLFAFTAASREVPQDWCYVTNFVQDHRPVAIGLPAGMGRRFRSDMETLVTELMTALAAAFESDEYQARRQGIAEEADDRQAEAFEALQRRAMQDGMALVRTPSGIAVAPTHEGEVLSREQVLELSEEQQTAIETKMSALQDELQRILRQVPGWQREVRSRLAELDREMAGSAISAHIGELRENYTALPKVIRHLEAVQEDIIAHAEQFLAPGDSEGPPAALSPEASDHVHRRYGVNLLIDHADLSGAPVIYEDNPTFQNLVGRVEHRAQMGALMTDYTLIKPGALLHANGGYLILDARGLLQQAFSWDGLKRALKGGEVRIESLRQQSSAMSTVSLEPEPIPLQVKIALIGDRELYYQLSALDPEFRELFKVAADFDDQMPWDDQAEIVYARRIATLARREGLMPFDRGAVERLMVQSARLAADSEKLSTRVREISDVMLEADYWARQEGREIVGGDQVQRAIDAQIKRVSRIRERSQEAIVRETKLIDTDGAVVGQINGLSVLSLGNFAFGQPTRITASVSLGQGQVVDIEREVDLGGPLHSKGMLILTGFLTGRYAQEQPLSLSASLVFEQSYGGVDGDSASSAELYALLSAVADIPIKQSIAVTGSVNQRGEVQAIGGVNEKIEGFYDLCAARGLTGDQGVLIPASNVKHLLLRHDIVEAVAAGRFHVMAAEHIDQGIETLTGVPAGKADDQGIYPEETINGRAQRRLKEMAEKLRTFGQSRKESGDDEA